MGFTEAYRGMAGRAVRTHRYETPAEPGRPVRANLIFLHGHGGNFLLYPLAWEEFAKTHSARISFPTFEYGNWDSPRSVETVRLLVAELKAADPNIPIYLAGISQGGAGVSRAGAELGKDLAGLVYISPTVEMKVIGSQNFRDAWRGRRVLIFQGGRDRNVHPRTVIPAVESMRAAGTEVDFIFDESEDHFFFFGQRERVQRAIAEWMGLQA